MPEFDRVGAIELGKCSECEPAHTEWVDGRDTRAQQAVWKGISAQFEVRIRVVIRGIEPRWSSKET